MARLENPTFSGGEMGARLQSRWDTAKYRTGLRFARNVLLDLGGGFYNRSGFAFVGPVYDSETAVRLIPFQFSLTQGYALEFGDHYMRVVANGGLVLEPEVEVTNITQASPAVMTIPNHALEAGDDVYLVNIEGMVEINDRTVRVLSVIDPDTVELDIDTTGFTAFSGSGGGVPGDSEGGTGGQPPPPEEGDPTPPFEDSTNYPPILERPFYVFS